MSTKDDTFVSNTAIKRLLSDIKIIMKNPLDSQGIYYMHDEENVLKGYAMIMGPADTDYENGYYFFEITYPGDYPHSPPLFKYHTNDGVMRFNPNLYRNGKVCLSVLNTWRGEGWTSCQTISSILLTVCSILCTDPLLNEPGIAKNHRDCAPYNEILRFKNIEIAIYQMLKDGSSYFNNRLFNRFKPIMEAKFTENYENILNKVLENHKKTPKPVELKTNLYGLVILVDYSKLLTNIKSLRRLCACPSKKNKKVDES